MNNQIKLLKKYGVYNYTIECEKIIINGSLYLSSLTSVDKDFLKGTTINGSLYLSSLTSVDKDFLKGTTINGYLDLRSLTSVDKDLCNNNVKQLKIGYNKEKEYCFFDGILSKVLSFKEYKVYEIFTTPFNYIVKKGKHTAHGDTVKKAIEDLEFKIISEKLRNEPIQKDTIFTIQYYRLITGACELGVKDWMKQNNIEEGIKAVDLLPLLEKTNAYGLNRFKQLASWLS